MRYSFRVRTGREFLSPGFHLGENESLRCSEKHTKNLLNNAINVAFLTFNGFYNMTRSIRTLILLLLLISIGAVSFPENSFAKRSRRSFSSRSSSSSRPRTRSKGSSFSSSQKKSSSGSKSYSSRSRTHDQKGSAFSTNSTKTSRGTNLADAARRAESKSKFQSAQGNQTYKDVVKSDPALRESLTVNNTKTRNKRRTDFYNSTTPRNERYYYYRPNATYRDPYDNFFFRYVTLTWLFHHWDNIDKARFDEQQRQELEAEFAEMEAQGLERDPEYIMEGTEPDLQYSDDELAKLQDTKEVLELEPVSEETEGGFTWLTLFLIGLVALGGIYFTAVRRY